MSDWKFKLNKLKQLILSAVEPSEPTPMFLEWISAHLQVNRGERSMEEVSEAAEAKFGDSLDGMDVNFTWEPLSDEVGRPASHYDWNITATMYRREGAAFWLVIASFPKKPFTGDLGSIARAIQSMGGDPDRDLVTVIPTDDGKHHRWYTWENRDPLLEVHMKALTPSGNEEQDALAVMRSMKVLPRGSVVEDGYTCMPPMPSITPRVMD